MDRVEVIGVCRFCKCTAASPCKTRSGDECGWVTKRQDLCTGEQCVMAADREKKARRLQQRREAPFRVLRRDASGRATHFSRRQKKAKKARAA